MKKVGSHISLILCFFIFGGFPNIFSQNIKETRFENTKSYLIKVNPNFHPDANDKSWTKISSNIFLHSTSGQLSVANPDIETVSEFDVPSKISPNISNLLNIRREKFEKQNISFLLTKPEFKNQILTKYNLTEVQSSLAIDQLLTIPIESKQELLDILSDQNILYADVLTTNPTLLNDFKQQSEGAYAIKSSTGVGGEGLSGLGVTVGLGDGGLLHNHLDIFAQQIEKTNAPDHWHAAHVAGTIVGAGNVNPRYEGYATNAHIIVEYFLEIINNAVNNYKDFGMTITNNSYSTSFNSVDCNLFGKYNYYSLLVDKQLYENKKLIHVFASGNSGGTDCQQTAIKYKSPYGTVLDGGQSSKNAICVGNLQLNDSLNAYFGSSCGPTFDGRMKPELASISRGTISSYPNQGYGSLGGTSQAAPSVSGALALLTEYYKKVNNGQIPDGALLKSILCNTAEDLENVGPDYKTGFGKMNLVRAVKTIKNHQYFAKSIPNQMLQSTPLSLPSGAKALKVLLYWPERNSLPFEPKSLISNLDLTIEGPSGQVYRPLVLDPRPTHCHLPAVPGIDSINNIEQVTILLPESGLYQIKVNGTSVYGYNDYYLTYEIENDSIELLFPVGGEKLLPNQKNMISWSLGNIDKGTFDVFLSKDGGTNYVPLATNLYHEKRAFDWTTDTSIGNNFKIKIVNNLTHNSVESNIFTILPEVKNLVLSSTCPNTVSLNWDRIPGMKEYKIYSYRNGKMKSILTTVDTFAIVGELKSDTTHWFAIAPVDLDGFEGTRNVAKSIVTNAPICQGVKDLALIKLITPTFGRKFTQTTFGNQVPITFIVKNSGSVAINNINAFYSINNTLVASQTFNINVSSGEEKTLTFTQKANLSSAGNYDLKIWIDTLDDPNIIRNNELSTVIVHAANLPIALSNNITNTFKIDFENERNLEFDVSQNGILNKNYFDYHAAGDSGRLRTFVSYSMIPNGTKAITIDSKNKEQEVEQDLILNLNLSNYVGNKNVKLYFNYIPHGMSYFDYSRVYARGSETDPWVEIYSLKNLSSPLGKLVTVQSLPIGFILHSHNQSLSSSSQIKFSFKSRNRAVNVTRDGSITIDDICLVETEKDLEINSIITENVGCGLSAFEYITIKICNNTDYSPRNVDIYAKVNLRQERKYLTIESFEPFECKEVSIGPFNMAQEGLYTFNFRIEQAEDQYLNNNTWNNFDKVNSPIVSTLPYYQDFEQSNDGWCIHGVNSSWEKGKPAKSYISGAVSGTNCYSTGLYRPYNSLEKSYLISPCFDFSNVTRDPYLSFNIAYQLEQNFDKAWVEYSEDGMIWKKLGTAGEGYNWYNNATDNVWDGNFSNWQVSSIKLPITSLLDKSQIKIRFVIQSDDINEADGLAIDNIHIYYDLNAYNSFDNKDYFSTSKTQDWVDVLNTNLNIASIFPMDILPSGAFRTSYFKNPDPEIRTYFNSLYLDRNWRIIPTNNFTDCRNFKIRLFFTDNEIQKARSHSNGFITFKHGYDIKVLKYNGVNRDVNIDNNDTSMIKFIEPKDLHIYPIFNGYMVEFMVMDFGEFYIFPSTIGPLVGPSPPENPVPFDLRQSNSTVSTQKEITLYPNPAFDYLTVSMDQDLKPLSYQIINNLGHIVLDKKIDKEPLLHVDLKPFMGGLYLIDIKTEKGNYTKPFFKIE